MLIQVFSWMLKTKAGQGLAVGTASGSLLALIFSLHNDVIGKIEAQRVERREYVQLVMKPVEVEIKNLKKETVETKELIKDIHKHLLRKGN